MHIAIIPDGNRRWAKEQGVPALEGHRRGAEAMHNAVDHLIAQGVKYLTVWGFSTDNWKRADNEVNSLFDLLAAWIEKDTPWLHEKGVRLKHIGRLHELPPELQDVLVKALAITRQNLGLTLNLAFNYTGRAEILDAVRRIITDGPPIVASIDEEFIASYLDTSGMPDVDMVIRTAGEFRLSNFLLWQTAYSEFYFTPTLWPDFNEKELEKALQVYSERQRRFGGD
ncbi:Isoprenyl transferase [subsurface metagenome]